MRQFLLLLSIILFSTVLTAQETSFNMSKLGQYDDNTVVPRSGLYFNEVWGYVDGNGNEYGVIGSPAEVHFVDVTNPASPSLKQSISGTYSSVWRDFKSYGNYVYGVHDGGAGTKEGLSIYDMGALPAGNITLTKNNADFGNAHNIFVDEAEKRLYVAGSNTQFNGLIVYDLTNPAVPSNPVNISLSLYGGYVHDLYVRDNIAYCNSESGSNGGMWVYDLNDLNNIVNLTQQNTGGYNHSSWMTDDGTHVVYATESQNYPLYIVDVSDVMNGNLSGVTSFKEPNLAPAEVDNMAHNPLILGDYCYASYYEDGVQVWDISDRTNPTLAGYYDMSNNSTYNGFFGAWGVYPFLPSGNILVSDDEKGLYILSLDINLPVELTEITAMSIGNKNIEVKWNTASELNNAGFRLERSRDGVNFQSIAFIAADANSSSGADYNYIDNSPHKGVNYYRLIQVDLSGEETYSEVVQASILSNSTISIAPNPVKSGSEITLAFGQSSDVDFRASIYTLDGKILLDFNGQSLGSYTSIPNLNLVPGVYLLQVDAEGKMENIRLVITE